MSAGVVAVEAGERNRRNRETRLTNRRAIVAVVLKHVTAEGGDAQKRLMTRNLSTIKFPKAARVKATMRNWSALVNLAGQRSNEQFRLGKKR